MLEQELFLELKLCNAVMCKWHGVASFPARYIAVGKSANADSRSITFLRKESNMVLGRYFEFITDDILGKFLL